MRLFQLILCLVLAAVMLAGCAKPWTNPQYEGRKKVRDYHFDKDSTDCSVMASEQYPLDKRKQLTIYNGCMEKRGWEQPKGFFYTD